MSFKVPSNPNHSIFYDSMYFIRDNLLMMADGHVLPGRGWA